MNIVKIQEVIAHRKKSNSVLHKENQNNKSFSPHNHFELMQRILNFKFVSKINLYSLRFRYSFSEIYFIETRASIYNLFYFILLINFKLKILCLNLKRLFGEKHLIFCFCLEAIEFDLVR